MIRRLFMCTGLALVLASPLAAQDAAPQRKQALSASPILALFEILNAEYERALGPEFTGVLGVGYWSIDDVTWLSTDLKVRFYPNGKALEGFSIGGIVGLTNVDYVDDLTGEDASESAPTIGVDLNWSSLLGDTDRWYVGAGLGAKRYFIDEDEVDNEDVNVILPTARLAFGIAF